MTTARDTILDKITKAMALTRLADKLVVAMALRQARADMQAHVAATLGIAEAETQECAADSGNSFKPPCWEGALAVGVADAFDCSVSLARGPARDEWVFAGPALCAQVAAYVFRILFDQADRARAHYKRTVLSGCQENRTRRADLFCDGWVLAVIGLVERVDAGADSLPRASGDSYQQQAPNLPSAARYGRRASQPASAGSPAPRMPALFA